MSYLYRGNDRRMIEKATAVLKAIIRRDKIAMKTTKKSSAISTRMLILDANPPGTGPLYMAAQTLLNQFATELAALNT